MATLWQILKPEDKVKLARLYEALAGFPFIPPGSPDRSVHWQTKIESPEEIDKLMREKPKRVI